MNARKTYTLPENWNDITRIKIAMRIDMLKQAQEGARDAGIAAKSIGMTRNAYVLACRRFGVEVEHLLQGNHPRWGRKVA